MQNSPGVQHSILFGRYSHVVVPFLQVAGAGASTTAVETLAGGWITGSITCFHCVTSHVGSAFRLTPLSRKLGVPLTPREAPYFHDTRVASLSVALESWRLIVPLSRPAIAVTALFSVMTAWNEYILAATFMSDESAYTLPVRLQHYVGDYTTEWGYFAAGAIIVSVPVMALFFALQKHLVGGLTAGSVKG